MKREISKVTIKKIKKGDEKSFIALIDSLADYEKLKRPTKSAKQRLIQDGFGKSKRFEGYLAFVDKQAVGYAIIFETYSSFMALPTLYLEDIFILPDFRSLGIGRSLFKHILTQAKKQGCGRMEWVVLDWNKPAIKFYDKIGARHLKEWYTYRIDQNKFNKILKNL
ncbi:MAG: GNAT family N-acetyltransferase [Ignavibacteriales bacterium]|nr:GNAT family N-acetyltransferase [Ignavibacteriales bacterium]